MTRPVPADNMARAALLVLAAATVGCSAFLVAPVPRLASPRSARRLRATPLGFEDVSTLALASFASKRPEINAAANESFFEKAPLVFGSELGLALLVYVAFKISGRGDALEGYDLLGRKKEKGE